MKRALVLLLCAAGACSGGKTPPPSGHDADPAGKVVAIDGKVTAQRPVADAPVRVLVRDDSVFADDTITTAPQASVKILLGHNHVTWSLDADQSRRVDQSLAWTAPEGSTSGDLLANQTDDRTAAAGRHVESEGMTTVATVENSPPGGQAQAIAEPPPPPVRTVAKPPADTAKPKAPVGDVGGVVTGDLGLKGTGSGGGGAGDGKGIGLGSIGGTGGGLGAGSGGAPAHRNGGLYPQVYMSIAEGSPAEPIVQALAARIPGVKQCYQVALNKDPSVTGELRFAITLNENGTVIKADVTRNTTSSPDLASCVRARLMRMVTPKPDRELQLLVVYRLHPST